MLLRKRKAQFFSSSLMLVLALFFHSVEAASTRPNIILILADDIGIEAIGAYGGRSYATPRIDQLADQGVRFDHGYAQPLGTHSRVKLMTGLYNSRNYLKFAYLDPEAFTFAHLLKSAGYTTAVTGKWQLADKPVEGPAGASPKQAGFDEHLLWRVGGSYGNRYWGPLLQRNGELELHEKMVYGPDLFSEYAIEFIKSHRDAPFFLYYPMVLTHVPFELTPDADEGLNGRMPKFRAMVSYMDKLVGRVQDAVMESGLADNTVIFFIGDNGAHHTVVSRVGKRKIHGGRGKTTSAGIKVPFIAWGPSHFSGQRVSRELVDIGDILPTLAELSGAALPFEKEFDGVSLMPLLSGEESIKRDSLFMYYKPWRNFSALQMVYDRQFKLYDSGEFFDLIKDPAERSPLNLSTMGPRAAQAYELLSARLQAIIESHGQSTAQRNPVMELRIKIATLSVLGLLVVSWLVNRQRLKRIRNTT